MADGTEELLKKARAGNVAALGQVLEFFRHYLALLARVQIGQRLQGKLDESDVVQEAFLAAHRNFAQFRGTTEAQFMRWLRQILAAKLVDQQRRYLGSRGRDVRLEREIQDALDSSSALLDRGLLARQPSPAQQAAGHEEAVRMSEALARLPQDYRDVVVLRHLEGLTFPQVAKRMGRTVDSVEKLWLRALSRLRQIMKVAG
jgi:RNA polymerase sigma-70 factor (ECF subfamily)